MASVLAGSFAYHEHIHKPCVVTIGNFDGVHLGHQRLLTKTIEEARNHNVLACAFTFEPPPRTLLAPNLQTPRIQSWQDKVETLLAFGLDCVIVEEFSLTFAGYPPHWFAREIIGRRLQAHSVVVGYDFRYGKARGGTTETLRRSLPKLTIHQQAALKEDNEVISSSRIRSLVQDGQVLQAALLLSRPYSIRGIVVSGKQEGRKIGFPTANIFSSDSLIPDNGVYAVRVQVNRGDWYLGMANLGTQPTFGRRQFQIEVNLFDFQGDLYGEELTVAFIDRIRSERRFNHVSDLVAQLNIDKVRCLDVLSA